MSSPLPGTPLTWSPHGASDTVDASTAFAGSMAALTNLIPDPTTTDLWTCRPAAINLVNFLNNAFSSGFSSGFGTNIFVSPTFVSVVFVVGSTAYGMVSTARFAGKDEPFSYNLVSGTFNTISGVTSANTPISPATTGAWNPPHMDLIGTKIIVTHPGFIESNGYFGVIDVSNPSSPTWTSTNTTGDALPYPPQWVTQYGQRAWYLVNPPGSQPAAYCSDVLLPLACTGSSGNFTPIFTFGDNVPLTCSAGLALQNQLGGIIQSLMVFKGVTNIYQITGDPFIPSGSTSNLYINTLNVATGTYSPNSVCNTEKGIVFVAPDGVRVIDFTAKVSDPIGKAGAGITFPFYNPSVPSRICGAYNNGIYRVQVTNTNVPGSPPQQWWYDFVREVWSGPHTQQTTYMAPYNDSFVVVLSGIAALWSSDVVQSSSSTYVENGTQLTFTFTTSPLPDTDQMSECAMIETTTYMTLVAGNPVTVYALDQSATILDTVMFASTGTVTVWGAFLWGGAPWGGTVGANAGLYPRQIAWHYPIVFRRLQLSATGKCASNFRIGRTHLRYQVLGYLQQ